MYRDKPINYVFLIISIVQLCKRINKWCTSADPTHDWAHEFDSAIELLSKTALQCKHFELIIGSGIDVAKKKWLVDLNCRWMHKI